MSALGRGLSSLIPKRNSQNAEDVLDEIDSMESLEGDTVAVKKPQAEEAQSSEVEDEPKKNVSVVEDFDDFEEIDSIESEPMPSKPLTSPISIDPSPQNVTPLKSEEAVLEEGEEIEVEVQEEAENEEEVGVPVSEPEEEDVQLDPQDEAESLRKTEELVAGVAGFGSGAGNIWDKHEEKVMHVAIGDIHINPLQPRHTFDEAELEELRESIDQHGILQPLVVRRLEEGYELIAGERRLRAAKSLNWDKVPCVVRRDVKSDQSRLVFALIENIQRQNLNPIEEALAYRQLNEEYGLTHEEIGHRVGRSRVGITNIVRILQLPAEIQRGLTEGKVTMGHARAILMIPDEEKQIRFYRHLLDEGLTVRKAEIRARRIQRTMKINDPMRRKTKGRHPLALRYAPALEERYGYDAYVKYLEDKNRFEVTFRAHSEGEIQELVGRLLGTSNLPDKDQDSDVIDD